MKTFAVRLTAAMEYAKITNENLAKHIPSVKKYLTTHSNSSSITVSHATISRWRSGAKIDGKVQQPSQRKEILSMIKPLRLAHKVNGLDECNGLLQSAGFPPLDEDEQEKYNFPTTENAKVVCVMIFSAPSTVNQEAIIERLRPLLGEPTVSSI